MRISHFTFLVCIALWNASRTCSHPFILVCDGKNRTNCISTRYLSPWASLECSGLWLQLVLSANSNDKDCHGRGVMVYVMEGAFCYTWWSKWKMLSWNRTGGRKSTLWMLYLERCHRLWAYYILGKPFNVNVCGLWIFEYGTYSVRLFCVVPYSD